MARRQKEETAWKWMGSSSPIPEMSLAVAEAWGRKLNCDPVWMSPVQPRVPLFSCLAASPSTPKQVELASEVPSGPAEK